MLVSQYSHDSTLLGPHVENNDEHGLVVRGERTEVVGANVWNNSRASADTYDGLFVDSQAVDTSVLGGYFLDRRDFPTQRWGIREDPNAAGTVVRGPHTRGNATGGVDLRAADSAHNGVATEDLGTAPTSAPAGNYPEGTTVRNANADNDATWQLVGGTWVRIA